MMDFMRELEKFGYLFYFVGPKRNSFETLEDVPDYAILVVPYFFLLFLIEGAFLRKTKTPLRINDAIASVMHGILQELSRIFFQGWKLAAYIYIYNNWRIITLPFDSLWTWWLGFLAVDFLYYWGHRACHEVNFLWAAHQVHHSSEDYNVATALRLSVFQNYLLMVVNLPMAFLVPPSGFLVHSHLNLIFQFWLHTELIESLGPLEYILNTPSHHRVHHGRNRYCIDKNYAATLIIWDKMFGTFQKENKDEKIAYGLTHPVNSFEPCYVQLHHYIQIWKSFWALKGWKNKLSVLIKGPGWSPGTPWFGNAEDIPDVRGPVEKYDPPLPKGLKVYIFWHFVIVVFAYHELMVSDAILPWILLYGITVYVLYSLSVFGTLLDAKMYAPWMELIRCITYFLVDYFFLPYTRLINLHLSVQQVLITSIRTFHIASVVFWLSHCIAKVTITLHPKPKKVE